MKTRSCSLPAVLHHSSVSPKDHGAGESGGSGERTELIIRGSLLCVSFHVGPSAASLCVQGPDCHTHTQRACAPLLGKDSA